MSKSLNNLNLIYELSHVYRDTFIRNFLLNYMAPEGLNRTHLQTLLYISFANNPKMSEISNKMGLEKGSFTPVAQKLLDLGYIEKTKTNADRRKSILNLTEKGKKLTKEYSSAHAAYIQDKLNELGESKSDFMAALKKVLEFTKKLA